MEPENSGSREKRGELAEGAGHPTSSGMMQLPSFATTALLAFARRIMTTEPAQILGPEGDPYLRRWWLEKDAVTGSVYVHDMLRSDQDAEMHDHPGDNLSIVLDGEMIEHRPDGAVRHGPGTMVSRRAEDRHRIEIRDRLVTIFVMGERVREWGFWEGDRFVPSQQFFSERGYF